ncbi:MAG: glycosyltransferase [Pirellulales bacterium]|nr:glycosyltransferase [Pirellulales bacterium]
MRLLIHDYGGYPFPMQLSRELAARGHIVRHVYCSSTETPRGNTEKATAGSGEFSLQAINLGGVIPKRSYRKRIAMERRYSGLICAACDEFRPDAVLSADTPSIPQHRLVRRCRKRGVRHVFWVQDLFGVAAHKLLSRQVPVVGGIVGRYFMRLDRESARGSDAVVLITEDFLPLFREWRIPDERMHVIHNWSVLDELPLRPRDNAWSIEQGLGAGPRVMYTGTLAMKHNPALLLELAKLLDQREAGEMIVLSVGQGIQWLREAAAREGIRSLRCLPFQPFERMADVLGSADVLVAILEPDAGVFSVPSKVLSYMCAGRAILGAMPADNLAARLIVENGAGLVTDPSDLAAFRAAAAALLDDPDSLPARGASARRYAEENFDILRIADRFEAILAG